MPKFNEYTEKTNPDDVDIFLLQDAASTRKISFLNIFNRIKTKLGLGELATKSKVAQSDLEAALANLIAGKLTSSGIANNLTTTDTTKVLAAPQGKALLESITSALTLIGSLDALTTTEKTNLVGSINELVTSLTALNRNLEYKTYTPTSVNANIGNKSIIVKANAYDCKINGFLYLNPATYDNDTILFQTPLKPTGTIYFSTTVAGRGFKVMTDGSVRANGVYTVSAGIYVYFGVSFAIA